MAIELVRVRDTISGQIGLVPPIYLTIFKEHLEEVDEDAKPYHAEMHQERTIADPNTEADDDDEDDPKVTETVD